LVDSLTNLEAAHRDNLVSREPFEADEFQPAQSLALLRRDWQQKKCEQQDNACFN